MGFVWFVACNAHRERLSLDKVIEVQATILRPDLFPAVLAPNARDVLATALNPSRKAPLAGKADDDEWQRRILSALGGFQERHASCELWVFHDADERYSQRFLEEAQKLGLDGNQSAERHGAFFVRQFEVNWGPGEEPLRIVGVQ